MLDGVGVGAGNSVTSRTLFSESAIRSCILKSGTPDVMGV